MRASSINRWLLVVPVFAVIVTAAGCSGSSGSPAGLGPTAAPSTSPSHPAKPQGRPNPALARLVLSSASASQAGVPVSQHAQPNGTLLHGRNSNTLDLCNAKYASEAKRTGRDQVAYVDAAAGAVIASEEVVSYAPGGAAEAYREVKHAAATCPTMVKEGSATTSQVTVHRRSSELTPSQLTVVQRVSTNSHTAWSAAIYQYDGNTFIGIYTYLPTRHQALGYAEALAGLAAKKLGGAVGPTV